MKNHLLYVLLLITYDIGACTTILMGKKTTADGSVIMAHNEDMGIMTEGKLWYTPSNSNSREIEIPHIPYLLKKSNAYWASGNANDGDYRNILVGMNEHGLSMSCNWMNSKEAVTENVGINRYALRQLILEQAQTAKEAVLLIGRMIEEYGQADWSGLTYCLSDHNESWIVETTTTQWVARRILDKEIHVVANRYTVTETFDLHSKNLYSFAIKNGWYAPNTPFDFRAVYGKPEHQNQAYDIDREERVMQLLEPKKGFITLPDIFDVLRDRYYETDKYRLPIFGECKRDYCETNDFPRPIATNFTQSSSVAHLRKNQDEENILWYAYASPNFSGYFPIYASADTLDTVVPQNQEPRKTIWMRFKELQLEGDRNYEKNQALALIFWRSFEQGIFQRLHDFEKSAWATSNEAQSRFTQACFQDLLIQQALLRKNLD